MGQSDTRNLLQELQDLADLFFRTDGKGYATISGILVRMDKDALKKIIFEELWKKECYNGVQLEDVDFYRIGGKHSMGGRVEAHERHAEEIAERILKSFTELKASSRSVGRRQKAKLTHEQTVIYKGAFDLYKFMKPRYGEQKAAEAAIEWIAERNGVVDLTWWGVSEEEQETLTHIVAKQFNEMEDSDHENDRDCN